MECDHLAAKEQENHQHSHEMLNLFEPDSRKIEEITVPWQAAEEKLSELKKFS